MKQDKAQAESVLTASTLYTEGYSSIVVNDILFTGDTKVSHEPKASGDLNLPSNFHSTALSGSIVTHIVDTQANQGQILFLLEFSKASNVLLPVDDDAAWSGTILRVPYKANSASKKRAQKGDFKTFVCI